MSASDMRHKPGEKVTAKQIAKMIDHSLLRPDMTRQEVEDGCRLAMEYECATVCVKPCDVEVAMKILRGTDVLVTTVVGFPHGSNLTQVKVLEAELAINQGCKEIDMVLNYGRLKSGDPDLVKEDVRRVCEYAHSKGVIVKVIFENANLTDDEKISACKICEEAGADFIKTSTGYASSGATIHDLVLMRKNCSDKVRIKAAGGVRTLDAALMVRAVGTERFGATATKAIVNEAKTRETAGTLCIPDSVGELAGAY
jgi:deoxyribose-phosphate aldolase